MGKVKEYLKRYFVTAMGAMAQGLFATLLISTIIGTIGKYAEIEFLNEIAAFAKDATGMAIGVAIALALKADMLVVLSSAVVGAMGNAIGAVIVNGEIVEWAVSGKAGQYAAGPAGAFFAVIIACELARLVSKKTKVDILVTPVITLLVGFGVSFVLCPLVAYAMYYIGVFIATATTLQPFFMGIIVAVVVGMVLTLPISSAAICAMIFSTSILNGLPLETREGFLLAGAAEDGVFYGAELLGDVAAAPGVLKSLGCTVGHFRGPGEGRDFAMYLPLRENAPVPKYFGLAFD